MGATIQNTGVSDGAGGHARKKVYTLKWNNDGTSTDGVTFQNTSATNATNTCTINHGWNTTDIVVAMVDVVGNVTEAANEQVDMNFHMTAIFPDSNNMKIVPHISGGSSHPSANDTYYVTIIG